MPADFTPPLQRAVISTFENLALLLPAEGNGGGDDEAPIARAVRVEFDGPRSGFVELRASARVIADAARNMLADDQPTPDLELDALAEIANVVCGNLVGELGSPHDVYRLAPPVAVPLEPLPAAHAAVLIRLERGRVQARLAFGPAA